jgi:hypothetical protein
LTNAIVFCRVRSWITGSRLVSLPFSDHCDPLVETPEPLEKLLNEARRGLENRAWKYLEIRPRRILTGSCAGLSEGQHFWLHALDLRPKLTELFQHFHKDCIQRKIRRAEREGLVLSAGRSQELLESFYRLLILTRRRQHLPPQPFAWFRNLVSCLGEAAEVLVASKQGRPVAAILTLHFRNTLTYKYGASERESSHFGGMQLLFWQAIEEAKNNGLTEFDLGRSDLTNPGLVAFKDRLGAARLPLTYWRYPGEYQRRAAIPAGPWRRFAGETLARLPAPLLVATGRLLYRHSA